MHDDVGEEAGERPERGSQERRLWWRLLNDMTALLFRLLGVRMKRPLFVLTLMLQKEDADPCRAIFAGSLSVGLQRESEIICFCRQFWLPANIIPG